MASFCSAAPSTYTEEVAKQERCKGDAELARSFFGASPDAVKAAYADARKRVHAKQLSSKKADDLRFLVYVGMSASSSDEAYMKGWSACMDGKYDFR